MADNPYNKIGRIVEQWCEKNIYTQMLVTISIGYEWETPHEETHLLDLDSEGGGLVWNTDWWEGQQHVELVGFAPVYKIRLKGESPEVAPVRHGRWTDKRTWEHDGEWYCSECGNEVTICMCGKDKTWEYPYCPNCGAKMDGEA